MVKKGNAMRKQICTSSSTDSIICPCCGISELERSPQGNAARCTRCDRLVSGQLLKTLEQIVSLPDALGKHACDCGHPELRPLSDGVMWCPSCGSEVLPFMTSESSSESRPWSEAYRCGWTEGLFGSAESFVHNEGLARWGDPNDRLDYYRGHRAGRSVRS
jgi:ribosomal protein L37AE/L43A